MVNYAEALMRYGDEAPLDMLVEAQREDKENIYLLMSDAFAHRFASHEGTTREERLRPSILLAALEEGLDRDRFQAAPIFHCRDALVWWSIVPAISVV